MLIGYARVSTGDQSLTLHIDALERGQEELILRPDDYESSRPDDAYYSISFLIWNQRFVLVRLFRWA